MMSRGWNMAIPSSPALIFIGTPGSIDIIVCRKSWRIASYFPAFVSTSLLRNSSGDVHPPSPCIWYHTLPSTISGDHLCARTYRLIHVERLSHASLFPFFLLIRSHHVLLRLGSDNKFPDTNPTGHIASVSVSGVAEEASPLPSSLSLKHTLVNKSRDDFCYFVFSYRAMQ